MWYCEFMKYTKQAPTYYTKLLQFITLNAFYKTLNFED